DAAGPGVEVNAVGADDVAVRDRAVGPEEPEADAPAADCELAGDVRADVVALNHVVGARDCDAVLVIAGDDVAQVGGRPADGVDVRMNKDAVVSVAAGAGGAVLVRADQVVHDQVAVGPVIQTDTDPLAAGDQVAVFLVGAADGVPRRIPDADAHE